MGRSEWFFVWIVLPKVDAGTVRWWPALGALAFLPAPSSLAQYPLAAIYAFELYHGLASGVCLSFWPARTGKTLCNPLSKLVV